MMNARSLEPRLLESTEPPAIEVVNAESDSEFVLLCEHASSRVPRQLASLGLSSEQLQLHIAVDIGARDVALHLATRLNAPAVIQNYSRLVCDCNRATTDTDFIVEVSDRIAIPGNAGLSPEARQRRIDEVYAPFHDAVTDILERRSAVGRRSSIVAIHSFTPVLAGDVRPWHVGVLYVQQSVLSVRLLTELRNNPSWVVGDNQPYSLLETYSESMTRHGLKRDIPALEVEIRQDLLARVPERKEWAARLAEALHAAAEP